MLKIMLVDDHEMFREGIASLLNSQDDMEVVGEAGSSIAACEMACNLNPDLILMDISLPDGDGIETIETLKRRGVRAEAILLTMHRIPALVEEIAERGIKGYVMKSEPFRDLLYAIRTVAAGKIYVSPSLLKEFFKGRQVQMINDLTAREKEVLTLVCKGYSSRQIGDNLHLSPKTVETYRARIMAKLGVGNMVELIRYAIRRGIISL